MTASAALWTPSRAAIERTQMHAFMQRLAATAGRPFSSYEELHRWSIAQPAAFWSAVWEACELKAHTPAQQVVAGSGMRGTRWMVGCELNFAENLLARRGSDEAIVAIDETGHRTSLSWDDLRLRVAQVAALLRAHGVGRGDRVAGVVPNRPEAVVAMLATTSLGAVWSSCSPDFGANGILDRFGQIEPAVIVACARTTYGTKTFDLQRRVRGIVDKMPSVRHLVWTDSPDTVEANESEWSTLLQGEPATLSYTPVPFDHPAAILFSSGTTGVPKCIVHGVGGTLLQHAKEHRLHADLRPDDTLFYFTTCGWMMWNWLVGALAGGTRIVLFDGSPTVPSAAVLWDLAEAERVTHFGTSPRFLAMCRDRGIVPRRSHDLSALRSVLSTGSPLAPDLFRWVYTDVKSDVHLASISGGTDIVSCFMLGSPIDPVYAGQIQRPGLGMAVDVFDDSGTPMTHGTGELVCTQPFPSMPVAFFNDPDGERYRRAYFDRFEDAWCHGDFVERTEQGGFVVHGRSDATLNPGGVRIGTAEIDRVVEAMPGIDDCIVIGQRWQNDTRVVLFVVPAAGTSFGQAMRSEIATAIRNQCSPRHVPSRIVDVPEIPRTRSGKKVELAVTAIIHGEPVGNREALANPGALDAFANRPELAS